MPTVHLPTLVLHHLARFAGCVENGGGVTAHQLAELVHLPLVLSSGIRYRLQSGRQTTDRLKFLNGFFGQVLGMQIDGWEISKGIHDALQLGNERRVAGVALSWQRDAGGGPIPTYPALDAV